MDFMEKIDTTINIMTLIPPNEKHIIEICYIYTILRENNWNKTHASEVLGISKKTLRRKIKFFMDLGFDIPRYTKKLEEDMD